MTRLAISVSHPIQHFCPLYGALARDPDLQVRVLFASSAGLKPYHDASFNREVAWQDLALDFPHEFLDEGRGATLEPGLDAPGIEAALERFGPDVVVVYGYRQRFQRRVLAWAGKRGVAKLMISDSESRGERALWRRALKRLVVPRIYRQVDGFLSVGDANEEHYRHYGVDPALLHRAPFPIDRELFEDAFRQRAQLRSQLRDSLGIPGDAVVFSMVGKLVSWKRQRDLLDAIPRLDAGSRAVAMIIGTGPDEQALRKRAAELPAGRAIFAGFVQPRDLPRHYAATDVYVHASEKEPHSLAISEAIYMGCPAVVSDRCGSYGPTDDVQPGTNGLVYRCGDPQALAGAIGALAESPSRREEMGAASRGIALHAQQLAYGAGWKAAIAAVRTSRTRAR